MESDNKLLVFLLAIALILNLVSLYGVYSIGSLSKSDIQAAVKLEVDKIDIPAPVIPSAEEIAANVVVPEAGALDNDKVSDLWEDLYSEEIDEIEEAAEDVADEELEKKDYKELLKYLVSLIEGLDEDSVDVDVEDVEVSVTGLGLDEDEDKTATVVYELTVEYSLEEGAVQDYKKNIIATADVVFDEGDLDDSDVQLVYA